MRRFLTLTRSVAWTLALLSLSVPALAQTPFAVRSVGQQLPEGDARMLGRGGWGLTVADSMNPGFKNLASTAWVRQVALSLSGYGESARHVSAEGSRRTYRTFVPDVRLALPLRKGNLAFTAGLKLERSSAWHTRVDSTWSIGDSDWTNGREDLSGNEQFEREGSVFKVPLGFSWRASPTLSGAVALNLERGSLRESLADYFGTTGTGTAAAPYRSIIAVNEDQFSGSSYTLATLFTPRPDIRLGVSWTSAHTLDATRKSETGGVAGRTFTDFGVSRPAELSAGFSAPLGRRWECGADVRRMDWKRLSAPEGWLAEPDWQSRLVEELQFGFGLERRGASERHGGWSNLPVRVGAGWHRWPYRVGGREIVEKSFSVGTGFPLKADLGQLDLALSYGTIGNEADNGLQSRFLRLAITVTGLETWW